MWSSSTNDAALESAIAGASEQYRHVCERDLQLAQQTRAEFCSANHRICARMAYSTHDD